MIRVNLLGAAPPSAPVRPLVGRREVALGAVLLAVAAVVLYNEPLAPPRSVVAQPSTPAPQPPAVSRPAARPSEPPARSAPPPSPVAQSAEITALEVRQEADSLVVLVRVDPRTKYNAVILQQPSRLVVDFPNTRLLIPAAQMTQAVEHPAVRRVRAGKPERGVARVVLDLSAVPSYKIGPGTGGVEIRIGPATP